jgi:hypothetical protein
MTGNPIILKRPNISHRGKGTPIGSLIALSQAMLQVFADLLTGAGRAMMSLPLDGLATAPWLVRRTAPRPQFSGTEGRDGAALSTNPTPSGALLNQTRKRTMSGVALPRQPSHK